MGLPGKSKLFTNFKRVRRCYYCFSEKRPLSEILTAPSALPDTNRQAVRRWRAQVQSTSADRAARCRRGAHPTCSRAQAAACPRSARSQPPWTGQDLPTSAGTRCIEAVAARGGRELAPVCVAPLCGQGDRECPTPPRTLLFLRSRTLCSCHNRALRAPLRLSRGCSTLAA